MKKNTQKSEQVVKPPKLLKRNLVEGIPGNCVLRGELYRSLMLSSVDLSAQQADHVSFEEAMFSQVAMMNTDLEEVRLVDVRLSGCDLVTANWYKAGLYRVELIDCRMTGFLAGEAHFEDVLFKNCQINLAQFRFSTFKSVRFEHCDLSESDLLEADLSRAVLIDCNLRSAELSRSKLSGVDFSSCDLEGAHIGVQELRGATISMKQAISVIQASGITVEF